MQLAEQQGETGIRGIIERELHLMPRADSTRLLMSAGIKAIFMNGPCAISITFITRKRGMSKLQTTRV